jgi:hypothetical protein
VKTSKIRQAAKFLPAAASVMGLSALGTVPPAYLCLWAFHYFLVDAVFTGRLPYFADMTAFAFFLLAALLLWFLIQCFLAALCLGLYARFAETRKPGKTASRPRKIPPLQYPPLSWAFRLFEKIAGPG